MRSKRPIPAPSSVLRPPAALSRLRGANRDGRLSTERAHSTSKGLVLSAFRPLLLGRSVGARGRQSEVEICPIGRTGKEGKDGRNQTTHRDMVRRPSYIAGR